METWKEIEGYEGLYAVSDRGNAQPHTDISGPMITARHSLYGLNIQTYQHVRENVNRKQAGKP